MFHRRDGSAEDAAMICHDCPVTVEWEHYTAHRALGGARDTYVPGIGQNERYNYFWTWRPKRAGARTRARGRVPATSEDGGNTAAVR